MTLKNARRFFPVVTGNTVGSHKQIVDQLKKKGVKDVQKIEDCDFTLAFCPVVSRLGTDIEAAMQVIPVDKPVILVVLHHTFDEDAIVPESSRLVTRSDVVLTVDFLFFETRGLLRCNKNDISLQRICDELKLTKSILPGPRTVSSSSSPYVGPRPNTLRVQTKRHDLDFDYQSVKVSCITPDAAPQKVQDAAKNFMVRLTKDKTHEKVKLINSSIDDSDFIVIFYTLTDGCPDPIPGKTTVTVLLYGPEEKSAAKKLDCYRCRLDQVAVKGGCKSYKNNINAIRKKARGWKAPPKD